MLRHASIAEGIHHTRRFTLFGCYCIGIIVIATIIVVVMVVHVTTATAVIVVIVVVFAAIALCTIREAAEAHRAAKPTCSNIGGVKRSISIVSYAWRVGYHRTSIHMGVLNMRYTGNDNIVHETILPTLPAVAGPPPPLPPSELLLLSSLPNSAVKKALSTSS